MEIPLPSFYLGGGSSVCWEVGGEAEGSLVEPQCRQNIEGILEVGEGARPPSEHC